MSESNNEQGVIEIFILSHRDEAPGSVVSHVDGKAYQYGEN